MSDQIGPTYVSTEVAACPGKRGKAEERKGGERKSFYT